MNVNMRIDMYQILSLVLLMLLPLINYGQSDNLFDWSFEEEQGYLSLNNYIGDKGEFLENKFDDYILSKNYNSLAIKGSNISKESLKLIASKINELPEIKHLYLEPANDISFEFFKLSNIEAVTLSLRGKSTKNVDSIWNNIKSFTGLTSIKIRGSKDYYDLEITDSFKLLLSNIKSLYLDNVNLDFSDHSDLLGRLSGFHFNSSGRKNSNHLDDNIISSNIRILQKSNKLKELGLACYDCIDSNLRSISRFTNLEMLILKSNKYSDFSQELTLNVLNLKKLDIRLKGGIDITLGNLPNLEDLKINCGTRDTIRLFGFENLNNLKYLNVLSSGIQFQELPNRSSFRDLERVYLQDVSEDFFDFVLKSSALKELTVRDNTIRMLPKAIRDHTGLKVLKITAQKLLELPKDSITLSNLEVLSINKTRITEIPKWVGQLKELTTLDFSSNEIFSLPNSLDWSSLVSLNLSNNHIKHLPKDIGKLKELKVFNVSNNRLKSIPNSIDKLKKLEILNLSNSDEYLKDERLMFMYLAHNNITYLPKGVAKMSVLKTLDVSRNIQFEDGLITFISNCKNSDLSVIANNCSLKNLDGIDWSKCKIKHLKLNENSWNELILNKLPNGIEDSQLETLSIGHLVINESHLLKARFEKGKIDMNDLLKYDQGSEIVNVMALNTMNSKKAIQLLEKAAKVDSTLLLSNFVPDPYLSLLFRTGHFSKYIDNVEYFIRERPRDKYDQRIHLLGMAYRNTDQSEKAKNTLDRIISLKNTPSKYKLSNNRTTQYYLMTGILARSINEEQIAINSFDEAMNCVSSELDRIEMNYIRGKLESADIILQSYVDSKGSTIRADGVIVDYLRIVSDILSDKYDESKFFLLKDKIKKYTARDLSWNTDFMDYHALSLDKEKKKLLLQLNALFNENNPQLSN